MPDLVTIASAALAAKPTLAALPLPMRRTGTNGRFLGVRVGDCNLSKAEHLAASVHLRRWIERNRTAGGRLRERFEMGHTVHNAQTSERIARWAYSQPAEASGTAWLRRHEFQPINESYLSLFA